MEHYYYCSLLDFFQQVKNAKTVLSFQAVQKQGHVQHQQKQGQGQILRGDLPQQHGRAGDAAVIQLHRRQKQHYAAGVDDAGQGQHQQVGQTQLFQLRQTLAPAP